MQLHKLANQRAVHADRVVLGNHNFGDEELAKTKYFQAGVLLSYSGTNRRLVWRNKVILCGDIAKNGIGECFVEYGRAPRGVFFRYDM